MSSIDKQAEFRKIAVEYWTAMASQLTHYDRGYALSQAEKWRSGAYENKCLNCNGEDCVCCSFCQDGCDFECNQIIAWKQEQLIEETTILNQLTI